MFYTRNLIKYYVPFISKSRRQSVDLSYKIIGFDPKDSEPPPILLFHGFLGNKQNWQSYGKVLVKVLKCCVISVDLRNHGLSPHAESHTYEALADDVLKLYSKLMIKKANLIGHSMGGRAAMVLALKEPSKVENLVVIDISPVSTTSHLTQYFPKVLEAMKKVTFKDNDTIGKARAEARKQLMSTNIIRDDVLLNAILMNINVTKSKKTGWICNLDVLIKDFNNIADFPPSLKVRSFFGPTLFVGGQQSDYLPPDDLVGIRQLFPRAVVKYIPKAGHNVHVDNPATFLHLVVKFLRINSLNYPSLIALITITIILI